MSKSSKKPSEENVRGESVLCERALLVGTADPGEDRKSVRAHLDELELLTETMGIPSEASLLVPLRKASARFLIGSGKVEEIKELCDEKEIDIVIFDDDLSPSQQRNLENELNIAVIDRQEVILDIFAGRATTREAVLQVALARMEYSMPRLTRAWTHLSRQKGGTKGTRGEGETQLEVDRRIVQNRITALKKELNAVRRNRDTQRKKRLGDKTFTVSIVGYTNAGKSTLINALCNADVFTEDKLFATLDPSTRKLSTEAGRDILLTDTVGFIRKLPHSLVEAFKSTLEEVVYADLILHVLDMSSPEIREHSKTTLEVLSEIGVENPRMITVLNKADRLEIPAFTQDFLEEEPLIVSARQGTGLETLKEKLLNEMQKEARTEVFLLPSDRHDLTALLYREASVHEVDYEEEIIRVRASVSPQMASRLKEFRER